MSDMKNLLDQVKNQINANDYKKALVYLEKILYLLKADYDSGINKKKSGLAFNKLLRVRKELIDGILTDVTYETLHLEKPKVDDIDYTSTSSFFEDENIKDLDDKESKLSNLDKEKLNVENEQEEISYTPEDIEFQFNWNDLPNVKFEDIAGLEDVKEIVRVKVLLPLLHPEALKGYVTAGGGGVCLYGPPGTGKTMMAAAIANTINAKFCSVTPSDLLHQGAGNTEKAVKALFNQARRFKCAVIYFDEMDSIAPKSTKSQYARQLRSEFLAQLQGISSYGEKTGNILFLICATNKPWDIDSAFLRPGRFGTKVYVDLPDDKAREYIITHRFEKIKELGHVGISSDIDLKYIVNKTRGFNCSDVTNLLSVVEELSMRRAFENDSIKEICQNDFIQALKSVNSSVQPEDIIKLADWRSKNDTNSISKSEEDEPDDEDDSNGDNDSNLNEKSIVEEKDNDDVELPSFTFDKKDYEVPDLEVPEFPDNEE